jgi:acetyltransferase-like isoleucine patch superfamily enzyme
MNKFIRFCIKLILNYKIKYKKSLFKKNSILGKNFNTSANSNCFSYNRLSIQIGDNCEICGILSTNNTGKIIIGSRTTIRYNSVVSSVNKIFIGSDVIISNNVRIYDHNSHPIEPSKRREMTAQGFYGKLWVAELSANKPVTISDNVWIGEHSLILKGVTIGIGSIVASSSVVTKDVPEYTIVAGNPAKIVKRILAETDNE